MTTESFKMFTPITIKTNDNVVIGGKVWLINQSAKWNSRTTHFNTMITELFKLLAQIAIKANNNEVVRIVLG